MRSNTGLKCNLAESAGKQPRPRLSAAALKLSFVSSATHPKNKRHVTFVPRSPIGTADISALDFNPRLQGANFSRCFHPNFCNYPNNFYWQSHRDGRYFSLGFQSEAIKPNLYPNLSSKLLQLSKHHPLAVP